MSALDYLLLALIALAALLALRFVCEKAGKTADAAAIAHTAAAPAIAKNNSH